MPKTRAEYMRSYVKARRHQRRAELIEMLGGKCVRCGATEDLAFDHIDPSTKRFVVGSSMSRAWAELVAEARKCQLLCPPCHREKGASRIVLSLLTATIDTGTTPAGVLCAGQRTQPRALGCVSRD